MQIRITIYAILGVLLLSTGVTSLAQSSGADVYKSKCAMCHGADGLGDTPAGKSTKVHPFNSPDVVKMSDTELVAIVTDGKAKMPAYKGKLTDAQVKEVVAYIRTLQKK